MTESQIAKFTSTRVREVKFHFPQLSVFRITRIFYDGTRLVVCLVSDGNIHVGAIELGGRSERNRFSHKMKIIVH